MRTRRRGVPPTSQPEAGREEATWHPHAGIRRPRSSQRRTGETQSAAPRRRLPRHEKPRGQEAERPQGASPKIFLLPKSLRDLGATKIPRRHTMLFAPAHGLWAREQPCGWLVPPGTPQGPIARRWARQLREARATAIGSSPQCKQELFHSPASDDSECSIKNSAAANEPRACAEAYANAVTPRHPPE